MLNVGDTAPNFMAHSDQDEVVNLSDFRGQWVVLYFFPKAMTSGCTVQAQGIRDDFPQFETANATVIGISPDSVARQAKFKDKESLPFILLADENYQIAEAYGVWKQKKMFGNTYWGNERTTFLIAPDGAVARVFRNVKPKTHSEQVLTALAELAAN